MKFIVTATQAHLQLDLRELRGLANPRRLAALAVMSDRNMQLISLAFPVFLLSSGPFFYFAVGATAMAGKMLYSYFTNALQMTMVISAELERAIPPGARILAFKVEANSKAMSYDFAFVTKQLELQSLEATVEAGKCTFALHQDSPAIDRQLVFAFPTWPRVRGAFLHGERQ